MKEKEFLPLLSQKLGIDSLNDMQKRMLEASSQKRDIILLSPTGSGKTIAFTLPLLKMLRPSASRVQAIVIAPSRELVIQIAGVINTMAADYKVTALYGGHKVEDEVNSLKITPDIIVATPGRLLDHINRRNFEYIATRIVVLDEFDKSLELGFEKEMSRIVSKLKNVSRFILTSATKADLLPEFLKLDNPIEVNFLEESNSPKARLTFSRVPSHDNDKLESLLILLKNLNKEKPLKRSIIFVNHRQSAERVAEYLKSKNVDCVLYHGALDQTERESAVVRFNNGSSPVLVATDLAARGLDIENVRHIIHYHQPLTPETYTHRNGRSARVDADGEVYILTGPDEELKEYVEVQRDYYPDPDVESKLRSGLDTIYISAGKREKLSKGDILGYLTKECGLKSDEVGKIDVFDHYSLAAIDSRKVGQVITTAKTTKIKGSKRKIELIK